MTLQMGVTVQRCFSLTTCLLDWSVKLPRNLAEEDPSSLFTSQKVSLWTKGFLQVRL